jgi:hypothetical protein
MKPDSKKSGGFTLKGLPHWWLVVLVARGTTVRHCCPKLLGSFGPLIKAVETRANCRLARTSKAAKLAGESVFFHRPP